MKPRRGAVSQLVQNDILIKRAVSLGGWPVVNKEPHHWSSPIGVSGKVVLVCGHDTMRKDSNGIPAQAAASEIRSLKISCRLGEAELVEAVMITVAPEKHVDEGAIAVRISADGCAAYVVVARGWWIVGKTKNAVRAGGGEILEDLRIIAAGRVVTVGDPAEIVESGKLADQ